jgi:hypothetical protein
MPKEAVHVKGAPRNKGRGITSRSIQPSLIQYGEVNVSSAEIKALFATPKSLLPKPGPGQVTEFVSAVLFLKYGSAAYATNGVLSIRETDASGTALSEDIPLASFLGKAADTVLRVGAVYAADGTALSPNKELVLSAATGETITGDSPIKVKFSYRIHATEL